MLFERTVLAGVGGHLYVVAKYHTKSRRKAKRLGWCPGLTHRRVINPKVCYIFMDGCHYGDDADLKSIPI
jgi:hypothetical protein